MFKKFMLILFIAGFTFGCQDSPPSTSAPNSEKKETTSPTKQVSLSVIDFTEYQRLLEKHQGKVVLVDFWATWCIPCVKKFPETVQLSQKFPDLVVISMSMDTTDQQEKVLKFLKSQQATFANYLYQEGGNPSSFERLGINAGSLPHYKIFDRQGKEVAKFGLNVPKKKWNHTDLESAVKQALNH